MPGDEAELRDDIEVIAMYGASNKRGLVRITMGNRARVLRPSKAREVAAFLLEAAGAAEGDEAMMKVLERIGAADSLVRQFLLGLRTERQRIDERAREEARRAIAYDQTNDDLPTRGDPP